VGKEATESKPVRREQKKLCPICKDMYPQPGPKYNVKDISFHLNTHSKDALIYIILDRLLKMEEKIDA
jgi:hypothetical protein